ncbi:MAG: class I SAM-dependent methyltransferase [Microscillaceae bacterium]|nr:class I SAM-dependent methyltransferase [Microscillaceae bacterium]
MQKNQRAWDVGTGNGQVAFQLAAFFEEIWATDASAAQIERARPHEKIRYGVSTAENSGLPDAYFDLITVAQALHWFEAERFYDEVRRVARPGAWVAVWGYNLARIHSEIDLISDYLYEDILGEAYWPPERKILEAGYQSLGFPFAEEPVPVFEMQKEWDLAQWCGYLESWSSVQAYWRQNGQSPLGRIWTALKEAWGNEKAKKRISWPLHIRLGQVYA